MSELTIRYTVVIIYEINVARITKIEEALFD